MTVTAGGDTVLAAMAYHGCGEYVRRAVDSILTQTHRDIICAVINDADHNDPPWPHLNDITDPRLIRHDMPANRGRYFIDATLLSAFPTAGWWALADPDDWSEPHRFATMLNTAIDGVALAPWWIHRPRGTSTQHGCRRTPTRRTCRPMGGYGSAVIHRDRIIDAGGIHPGYRLGYDTFLINALKLRGNYGVTDEPLAHKTIRAGSLTTHPATGMRSPARAAMRERRLRLWTDVWDAHNRGEPIAPIVHADIGDELHADVQRHAEQLHDTNQRTAPHKTSTSP